MRREIVTREIAYPPDFGSPTSLAIQAGDFIFVSGMLAWDRQRRIVSPADPHAQTTQALHNMRHVLETVGAGFGDIVKITFYLTDIRHKATVWEARKQLFGEARPASTLVGVTQLVDSAALLEIDAVAYLPRKRAAKAL